MPRSGNFLVALSFSAVVALCALAALGWRFVLELQGAAGEPAFLWTVVTTAIFAFAASCALSLLLTRRLWAGKEQAAAAPAGPHGKFDAGSQEYSGGGDLFALSDSVRKIGEQIQPRLSALEAELGGLKAILEAMEEGLVVVDAEKRVRVANAAARKMLSLPEGELSGRPLQEITRHPDLLGNIDLCLTARQTCSFQLQFSSREPGVKGLILARCSPFHEAASELSGAVAVLHDITELRRLERVRTEFVANVSHELRTPLTSLLGYLETLQEGHYANAEEARSFLLVCSRQAERLSSIVEDLLRLSRLENPQQEISAAEVDLGEVVASAVEQCRATARERGIDVSVEVPSRTATVWGDRGLLVQAISNLVENGVHYNRENGKVHVRLAAYPAAEDSNWEVSVADTGIGIPRESVGRIFERFYRVDKARSRERGGTGLGLSIVRHIALAHGASVHVESEMDKGSTFFLRFKAKERSTAPVLAV